MRAALKPFPFFVPGKGMLSATHIDVRVGSYELGGEIRGHYDVLSVTPASKKEGDREKVVGLASGNAILTKPQADAWGKDDMHFVHCVAENAGLALA